MDTRPVLALPEWTVLAILSQQPAHGFAVAQLTAPHGELGRVWQIPRPVIYRAIGRLAEAGLITPQSVEAGLGPQRTIYAASQNSGMTAAGGSVVSSANGVFSARSLLSPPNGLTGRPDASSLLLIGWK
jgi:hypothetical protein